MPESVRPADDSGITGDGRGSRKKKLNEGSEPVSNPPDSGVWSRALKQAGGHYTAGGDQGGGGVTSHYSELKQTFVSDWWAARWPRGKSR